MSIHERKYIINKKKNVETKKIIFILFLFSLVATKHIFFFTYYIDSCMFGLFNFFKVISALFVESTIYFIKKKKKKIDNAKSINKKKN